MEKLKSVRKTVFFLRDKINKMFPLSLFIIIHNVGFDALLNKSYTLFSLHAKNVFNKEILIVICLIRVLYIFHVEAILKFIGRKKRNVKTEI